jgi:hypothetical protein
MRHSKIFRNIICVGNAREHSCGRRPLLFITFWRIIHVPCISNLRLQERSRPFPTSYVQYFYVSFSPLHHFYLLLRLSIQFIHHRKFSVPSNPEAVIRHFWFTLFNDFIFSYNLSLIFRIIFKITDIPIE